MFLFYFLRIDPELQDRIFDAGIMYGSEKAWTFVKSKYLTVVVLSKRSQLMKALAKSRDDSLFSRYIQYLLHINAFQWYTE